jgi:hypothetical protein
MTAPDFAAPEAVVGQAIGAQLISPDFLVDRTFKQVRRLEATLIVLLINGHLFPGMVRDGFNVLGVATLGDHLPL